jgi:enamine deaminase RidA (YjgF/YER057c/UK114 family)
MRKRLFSWLGEEFIELSAEAQPRSSAAAEAQETFRRFDEELKVHGCSLDNTVRSRLWGRDRESRDAGSNERVKVLAGKARSASSSYIAPAHFDSAAKIAVDLLAMKPTRGHSEKRIVEYDPPIVPIRFLTWDSVAVLSGVTAVLPDLEKQMTDILPRITASLLDAGSSWERVARVSFYLHRSETIERLKELFARHLNVAPDHLEYAFVDGYSSPGKLCEVEVTATI